MSTPYVGQQYKLRAGAPMPIGGGSFILHTFGAEIYKIEIYTATDSIVGSSQFRGQGGNLISASYTRLNDRSGNIFSGKLVYTPTFIDEGSY